MSQALFGLFAPPPAGTSEADESMLEDGEPEFVDFLGGDGGDGEGRATKSGNGRERMVEVEGMEEEVDWDSLKKVTFQTLKPICVSILPLINLPPPPSPPPSTLLHYLERLHATLLATPPSPSHRIELYKHRSPQLLHYAFFPVQQLFFVNPIERFTDRLMEVSMRILHFLVRHWKFGKESGGVDAAIWNQLWTMVVFVLGGPEMGGQSDITKEGKKRREWSEETKEVLVEVLRRLLEMQIQSATDSSGPLERPPLPILAHTLTTLLGIAKSSPSASLQALSPEPLPAASLRLRLLALTTLKFFTRSYLYPSFPSTTQPIIEMSATPSTPPKPLFLLPQFLPGTVSALCRIIIGPSAPSPSTTTSTNSLNPLLQSRSSQDQSKNSKIVVEALDVLGEVIVRTVGDGIVQEMGIRSAEVDQRVEDGEVMDESMENVKWEDETPRVKTLEDFVDFAAESERAEEGSGERNVEMVERPSPPSVLTATVEMAEIPGPSEVPPIPLSSNPASNLTPSWLLATSHQLHLSLLSLLPVLRSHQHPEVRRSFSRFCIDLLDNCWKFGGLKDESLGLLVGEVLLLFKDDWELVSGEVRNWLGRGMAVIGSEEEGGGRQQWNTIARLVTRILEVNLKTLPSTIVSHNDGGTVQTSLVIDAAASFLATYASSTSNLHKPTITPGFGTGKIERWSWGLLRALELDRVALSGPSGMGAGMREDVTKRPWIGDSVWPLMILGTGVDVGGGASKVAAQFPELPLKHLHSRTSIKTIRDTLGTLGRSTVTSRDPKDRTGMEMMIEHFMSVGVMVYRSSSSKGDRSAAESALWIIDSVLSGLIPESNGEALGTKGDRWLTKKARKMAKKVIRDLAAMDESYRSQEAHSSGAGERSKDKEIQRLDDEFSSSLAQVEHVRGGQKLTMFDSLKPVTEDQQSIYVDEERNMILTRCIHLRVLATASSILESSFRSELLRNLYLVISFVGPSYHPLVRSHADVALQIIAYNSGYASPVNLILDNVDYVVNAVSQRLTLTRLDPEAPLVLVSMIRLVGDQILPLIHDVVDEVFDALDSFHGYDLLCSNLLAVLDTVMKAMGQAPEVAAATKVDDRRPAMGGAFDYPPDAQKEVDEFWEWYEHRKDEPAREEYKPEDQDEDEDDEMPEIQKGRPFGAYKEGNDGMEDDIDSPSGQKEEDQPPPATKSQSLCSQILSKAIPYLSQSSPFLRARVLSLISSGVPILALGSREGDLLPTIHRTWPFILNRLNDDKHFVVLEAASLIEALARYTGDFMSRRIVDDAWPRLKAIVERQQKESRHSALAGRTPFTTFNRLLTSILVTCRTVVLDVPNLKTPAAWDIATTFIRFLDSRQDPRIQLHARDLYIALGKVNADMVRLLMRTLVLAESTGGLEEGVRQGFPMFLIWSDADVAGNARIILDQVP